MLPARQPAGTTVIRTPALTTVKIQAGDFSVNMLFRRGRVDSYQLSSLLKSKNPGDVELDHDFEKAVARLEPAFHQGVLVHGLRDTVVSSKGIREPDDRLISHLEDGIDFKRGIHSGPLVPNPADGTGGMLTKTDARYLLPFFRGVDWNANKVVVVNRSAYPALKMLRKGYPDVEFVEANRFDTWLKARPRTRSGWAP